MPTLKLQSLDYGKNEISLTTKVLNNLNKINPEALDAKDLTDLSTIQGRFWISGPENCLKEITFDPDSKLDWTKSANSNNLLNQKLQPYSLFSFDDDFMFQNLSEHENYVENSEWYWTKYSYSGGASKWFIVNALFRSSISYAT